MESAAASYGLGVMALLRTFLLEPSAWTLEADGGGVVGSWAAFSARLL